MGPFDIVICGLKTMDGDTGQVGPELAEHLGVPHVCYVNGILGVADGRIRLTMMLDDGVETLDAPLPIVITVTKEINQPRLATLRGRLNARKAEIRHITSKDIQAPLPSSSWTVPTPGSSRSSPTPPAAGEVIGGSHLPGLDGVEDSAGVKTAVPCEEFQLQILS